MVRSAREGRRRRRPCRECSSSSCGASASSIHPARSLTEALASLRRRSGKRRGGGGEEGAGLLRSGRASSPRLPAPALLAPTLLLLLPRLVGSARAWQCAPRARLLAEEEVARGLARVLCEARQKRLGSRPLTRRWSRQGCLHCALNRARIHCFGACWRFGTSHGMHFRFASVATWR